MLPLRRRPRGPAQDGRGQLHRPQQHAAVPRRVANLHQDPHGQRVVPPLQLPHQPLPRGVLAHLALLPLEVAHQRVAAHPLLERAPRRGLPSSLLFLSPPPGAYIRTGSRLGLVAAHDRILLLVLVPFGQVLPVVLPDPHQRPRRRGPQLRQRGHGLVRPLVAELDEGRRQADGLGDAVHAQLARLVLVAIQQTRDEPILPGCKSATSATVNRWIGTGEGRRTSTPRETGREEWKEG